MKKIIFYELNEVPKKVLREFAKLNPNSAITEILKNGAFYETKNSDVGHLSPWITWPTLHKGVNNEQHRISDLNQNVTEINQEFPNYFDLIAQNGYKVGVFGSLHTCPIPKNINDYAFYIPDTFANSADTFPTQYRSFQSLNLNMVSTNGRNVNRKIPIKDALAFLSKSPLLGITPTTVKKIFSQIAGEIINKDKVVRRRTTQSQLSFDLFYKLISDKKPYLSTFFTNHVASSMHRYWPATFPNDYTDFSMPEDWQNRFKHEIWYTLGETDYQLSKLLRFVSKNDDFMLLVGSSMGQAAVEESYRIYNQLYLKNPEKLMSRIGINQQQWKKHLSMEPCYIFSFSSSEATDTFLTFISSLSIKNEMIEYDNLGENRVSVMFGQTNFDNEKDTIYINGASVKAEELGLGIVPIQDETGSYAYHIPEGILLVYGGGSTNSANKPESIPSTSIAPSILKHFDCPIPNYMEGPVINLE